MRILHRPIAFPIAVWGILFALPAFAATYTPTLESAPCQIINIGAGPVLACASMQVTGANSGTVVGVHAFYTSQTCNNAVNLSGNTSAAFTTNVIWNSNFEASGAGILSTPTTGSTTRNWAQIIEQWEAASFSGGPSIGQVRCVEVLYDCGFGASCGAKNWQDISTPAGLGEGPQSFVTLPGVDGQNFSTQIFDGFQYQFRSDIPYDDEETSVVFEFTLSKDGVEIESGAGSPNLLQSVSGTDYYAFSWVPDVDYTDGDYAVAVRVSANSGLFGAFDVRDFTLGSGSAGGGNEEAIAAFTAGGSESFCLFGNPFTDSDPSGTVASAIGSAVRFALWPFFWSGSCISTEPFIDFRQQLARNAPFKQGLQLIGYFNDAIAESEEGGNLELPAPPPFEGTFVLFNPTAVYEQFGGEDGWGTFVRPIITAGTALALAFYFYREMRTLFA